MKYAQLVQVIIATALPSIVLGIFLSSVCRWMWRVIDRRLPPRYLKRGGVRRRLEAAQEPGRQS